MRKYVRLVMDISCLTALNPNHENEETFSCLPCETRLEQIATELQKKGLGWNEVECVLLTQSAEDKRGQFEKVLSPTRSEHLSYDQLQVLFRSSPYLKNFWERAIKIPLISSGDDILHRIIARAEKRLGSPKIEKSARECALLYEVLNHQEDSKAWSLLKECATHPNPDTAPWEALKKEASAFSRTRLLFNPGEIYDLDKKEGNLPTLFFIGPHTQTLEYFKNHHHCLRFQQSGQVSASDSEKLEELLCAHSKNPYEKIIVYVDFDFTLCHNTMSWHEKNIDSAVNGHVASTLKKIKSTKQDSRLLLLTARLPFGVSFIKNLAGVLKIFKALDDYNIKYDDTLKHEIEQALEKLDALLIQQGDLHEEIASIEALSRPLEKLTALDTLFKPYLEAIPAQDRQYFEKMIGSLKEVFQANYKVIRFFCVSKVTKKYQEKHDLTVEISNSRHLSSSKPHGCSKATYIFRQHKMETQKTLVVLMDDNLQELASVNNIAHCPYGGSETKLRGNKLVDVLSIRVHEECGSPSDAITVLQVFLKDAARQKKALNPRLFRTAEIQTEADSQGQNSENSKTI